MKLIDQKMYKNQTVISKVVHLNTFLTIVWKIEIQNPVTVNFNPPPSKNYHEILRVMYTTTVKAMKESLDFCLRMRKITENKLPIRHWISSSFVKKITAVKKSACLHDFKPLSSNV